MNRQKIFEKYDGHCSFCGDKLGKGWHVWDIIPVQSVVTQKGNIEKVNTGYENLMPACKECGSVRIKNQSGKMDIEAFRNEINCMYLFCRNNAMYASSLRRAIKFGIIEEKNNPIVFYFEK
jgi:hypothetical protein